jgi:hypothetical protein
MSNWVASALAASLGSALCASSAGASVLLFAFGGGSAGHLSWKQDSAPTPAVFSADFSTTVDVTPVGLDPNGHAFSQIIFYPAFIGGGFSMTNYVVNVFGDPVYTGPEDAPVFAPGVYTLLDTSGAQAGTLSVTAIPEPGAWSLMLLGVGGFGAVLRRARARVTAAT